MDFSTLHYIYRPSGIHGAHTLLLLHAAGGNEFELMPLVDYFGNQANVLSVRGNVEEKGKTRFFKHRAASILDERDLEFRTYELIHFLKGVAIAENFDVTKIIALGYSNGASIAGSMLYLCPDFLSGAILLRPMKPFGKRETLANKSHTPVFFASGSKDFTIDKGLTKEYVKTLVSAGFKMEYHEVDASHKLSQQDLALSSGWFAAHFQKVGESRIA